MDLELAGKHFIVTGGSRGIGRAIALAFVHEGANVSICARDAGGVSDALQELQAKGIHAEGRALDVANAEELASFIQDAATSRKRLDGLVANASALASGSDVQDFEQAFRVDLMHTRSAAHAALPFLEESKGSIIAISSISGTEDYGYASVAYGTMKAALFFYIKSLARHVAPKGIRANVVSPGTTFFKGGYWDEVRLNDPKRYVESVDGNPLGRMATPEEIANVVVFLASGKASFVSGTNVVVDGTATQRIPN
jgi:NAD(P)-dependent dehydrogenase (short-subunit alcohol dehydrogenase family)